MGDISKFYRWKLCSFDSFIRAYIVGGINIFNHWKSAILVSECFSVWIHLVKLISSEKSAIFTSESFSVWINLVELISSDISAFLPVKALQFWFILSSLYRRRKQQFYRWKLCSFDSSSRAYMVRESVLLVSESFAVLIHLFELISSEKSEFLTSESQHL